MIKEPVIKEAPNYKKKKVSKKTERAKHKHTYEFGLCTIVGEKEFKRNYMRVEYCTICGKIYNRYILESEDVPGKKVHRVLTNEEIYEKYKNLKQFNIDGAFDKFVTI